MAQILRQIGRRALRSISSDSPAKSIPFIGGATKIEEERRPAFEKGLYLPVKIGDVLDSRYEVLSKMGFGTTSTVWFCRDRRKRQYVTLKAYTYGSETGQEAEVLKHMASIQSQHPGFTKCRTMLDSFEVDGPKGKHNCVTFQPLLISLGEFQFNLVPKILPEKMVKMAVIELLQALDFLHSEANIIHTDIQPKNILMGSTDPNVFPENWALAEKDDPSPRKITEHYTVYRSRAFKQKPGWEAWGLPLLADFGEARIGSCHRGIIQPTLYRAPEVILDMEWTAKVDIWNVGAVIWDLREQHHLFENRGPDGEHSDEHLLADMVSLLGSPPISFLRLSNPSSQYWDETGKWIGQVPIVEKRLEDEDEWLAGENQAMFLKFMRRILAWDPDQRPSARELMDDPWLHQTFSNDPNA